MSPRIRITILSVSLPVAASLLALIPAATSSGAPAERWSRSSIWATTVEDPQIREASGISRSTYDRTLAWLHNDSGDGPRFFAVGASGLTKAEFTVAGVHARDWEDMATGPRHHLWFGDIGDNRQQRDDISVIRVREPKIMRSRDVRGTVFTLRYADGPHNAEALLIRPHSGRLYIATKSAGGGGIYRAPKHLSKHHVNVLHRVASDPVLVTGGDFAPNGKHFVLRTHNWAYFYKKVGGRAHAVRLPDERQGEAIGYDRGSGSVRLASEGQFQPIWRVLR